MQKVSQFSEISITVCRGINLKSDTRPLQLKAKTYQISSKIYNIDNSKSSVWLYEKSSNSIFEQMGEKDSFLMNYASEDILKTTFQNGNNHTQNEYEISIDEYASFQVISKTAKTY